MTDHKQYREELLKWCNNISSYWESMKPKLSNFFDIKYLDELEKSCRELKEKLQDDQTANIDNYQSAKNLYEQWEQLNSEAFVYQEDIEVKTVRCMEIEEQREYREDLLEWCNNIFSHWENMKPRFSKLFDIKSLEEWERSCHEFKEKLQTDLKIDLNDYERAQSLYEQWDLLNSEVHAYQELIKVKSDFTTTISHKS
jgi:hypothetical protein